MGRRPWATIAAITSGIALALSACAPLPFSIDTVRATTWGLIETDGHHPYKWSYIDEAGDEVAFKPCTDLKTFFVSASYSCVSPDGTVEIRFLIGRYATVDKIELKTGSTIIPEACTIRDHVNGDHICLPISDWPTPPPKQR